MNEALHDRLANTVGKGFVIAPAGYGKTHLIAMATKVCAQRQLILTHTYAGVHSLREKMRALSVPSALYKIDTIASWSLRLCLYFPKTSNWSKEQPETNDWEDLYRACYKLLSRSFVQRIVLSSYSGIFVDEYQDCSVLQHLLIESISKLIPCRILGDPLQSIFGFGDEPVNWERDIYPSYALLGELKTPWRWHDSGARELADWLDNARCRLLAGKKISMEPPLPKGVNHVSVDLNDFSNRNRLRFFSDFLRDNKSVIAIYSGDPIHKELTHQLARSLGGRFSSIEEVEGQSLVSFIGKLETAKTSKKKLLVVIKFAKKCCTSIDKVLTAATKRGECAKVTKTTKFPSITIKANEYLEHTSSRNLLSFLLSLKENSRCAVFRRDLFYRLIQLLRSNIEGEDVSLSDSLKAYRRKFRFSGRPIKHNKLIGTTMLVKGLEYQHAIILNAHSMPPKDLYVALTRGSKTITIVTCEMSIPSDKIQLASELNE